MGGSGGLESVSNKQQELVSELLSSAAPGLQVWLTSNNPGRHKIVEKPHILCHKVCVCHQSCFCSSKVTGMNFFCLTRGRECDSYRLGRN